MGALWQYRWLVLVLLIAPTIAYCQYLAVERLATERCASAGGTWDEERDECTGLPAPRAAGSGDGDEVEAAGDVDATPAAPEPGGDAADDGTVPEAGRATDSPYDAEYVPSDGAGAARVDAPPGDGDERRVEPNVESSDEPTDGSKE